MPAKGKRRISITLDGETYDRVAATLRERGYPPGSLSYFLDLSLSQLDEYLEPSSEDTLMNVTPIMELEISRLGLVKATHLLHPNIKITEIEPQDEVPMRYGRPLNKRSTPKK